MRGEPTLLRTKMKTEKKTRTVREHSAELEYEWPDSKSKFGRCDSCNYKRNIRKLKKTGKLICKSCYESKITAGYWRKI